MSRDLDTGVDLTGAELTPRRATVQESASPVVMPRRSPRTDAGAILPKLPVPQESGPPASSTLSARWSTAAPPRPPGAGSELPRSSGFSAWQAPQNARSRRRAREFHDALTAALAVDGPGQHGGAGRAARSIMASVRLQSASRWSCALDPKSDTDVSMRLMSTRRWTRSWYCVNPLAAPGGLARCRPRGDGPRRHGDLGEARAHAVAGGVTRPDRDQSVAQRQLRILEVVACSLRNSPSDSPK